MEKAANPKLKEFFSQFKQLQFKRGQVILRDDTNPNGVFFIHKGNVRLFLNSEDGEELTALILKQEDIFPLKWIINNSNNIYNFEAMTDVEVFSAPKEKFLDFLKQNTDVMFELVSMMSFNISALIYRMQHLVFGNAHAKVASILVTSAKRFGEQLEEDVLIKMRLTHQDIATAAGITRETASIEMKKLEKEGLISYKERFIIVQDLKGLEEASFL